MENNKIKPFTNTNLCFTMHEGREKIKLHTCDSNTIHPDRKQLFSGLDFKREFQIHPMSNSTLCLTQHHHPKSGERLMVTSCQKAEENDRDKYDDTSRWEIGTFEGHDSIFFEWIGKLFGH